MIIWLLAIGKTMQNMNNPICFLAYAGGFAAGTYVGIVLEEKLAIGLFSIRVILPYDEVEDLKQKLVDEGFGVTILDGEGAKAKVAVVFSIFKRKDTDKIVDIINSLDSKAFYSIHEMRSVNKGVFPLTKKERLRLVRSIRNKK